LTRNSSGARPAAGWTNARLRWLSMMPWTTVRSDGRGCEFAALMFFGVAGLGFWFLLIEMARRGHFDPGLKGSNPE